MPVTVWWYLLWRETKWCNIFSSRLPPGNLSYIIQINTIYLFPGRSRSSSRNRWSVNDLFEVCWVGEAVRQRALDWKTWETLITSPLCTAKASQVESKKKKKREKKKKKNCSQNQIVDVFFFFSWLLLYIQDRTPAVVRKISTAPGLWCVLLWVQYNASPISWVL